MYQINDGLVEIPFNIVRQLIAWNENPARATDKRFVLAILLTLVERDDLHSNHIGAGVYEFISGKSFSIDFG